MIDRHVTVEKQFKPFTPELDQEIKSRAIEKGWGVFRHKSGISCMPHDEILDVRVEEAEALAEVRRLNGSESFVEMEISDDPESNVYLQVSFSAGRVVMTSVEASVVLSATYATVPKEAN